LHIPKSGQRKGRGVSITELKRIPLPVCGLQLRYGTKKKNPLSLKKKKDGGCRNHRNVRSGDADQTCGTGANEPALDREKGRNYKAS